MLVLCISCVTFFCIYGGFKRIVEVSEKLVPFMSLIYVASALVVLVLNFDKVGSVFFDIISSAFNVKSFFGGFIPIVITGFQRGIFSNEAGIGTSSIISSSDSCNDYRLRGFNQMFGIYITTLIICSATAIIIFPIPLFLTGASVDFGFATAPATAPIAAPPPTTATVLSL